MKLKLIFLLSLFLSITACADTNSVAQRKAYWDNLVKTQIPVGSSIAELNSWAQKNSLKVVNKSESLITINLEYLSVESSVCKGFSISLEIVLYPNKNIQKESVNSFGNCL